MATLKLKIIKSKSFEVKGEAHTHYTCAYKGRVFGVSTLRFEEDDITVDNSVLTMNTDVEVAKNTSTDPLTGGVKIYLDIVPKCTLELASY